MRVLLLIFALTSGLTALAAVSPAQAWYDRWGRWHPNYYHRQPPPQYYGYVPPPGYYRFYSVPPYAPPPVYVPQPVLPYYGPPPPMYYPPY
jgi:hypothetical protein